MATPIRELVISVAVEADTSGFKQLDDAQEKSTTGAGAMSVALGTLAADLVKAGIEAAKAGAAFVADLVFGTAEAADGVAKMSAQLNISAEGLQRLQGAAKLTGGDAATLDKGIRTLTKGLADAAEKGTGPAADALGALGLEVADIDSLLGEGDIEGAIGVIGDAFNATGDSAQKNAALLKLFGGAGSKLRPLIEEGTAGVTELGDAISATGSVIDDEALGQFEAMVDANFLLDEQMRGIKNTIATALAPAVTDIANKIGDWVSENDDFIKQDLPEILASLGEVLIDTATFVLDLLEVWREFIRDASDLAEILTEDVDPAMGGVIEGLTTMADFAAGAALAWNGLVLTLLEAAGAGEAVLAVFRAIDDGLSGGDEEVLVGRGAGAQQGAGTALDDGGVRTSTATNEFDRRQAEDALNTGDTTKIRKLAGDANTDPAAAERYTQLADSIEGLAADDVQAQADQKARAREASVAASRDRSAASRARGGKGGGKKKGGGGRGRAAPEESSVDDLISQALGGGGGSGLAKVRSDNALAGTVLNTIDQSVTITNGPVTLEVDLGSTLTGGESAADIGSAVALEVGRALDQRNKLTFDFFTARQNVGGG